MQIQQALSPNYSSGRRGRKIIAIVNHITAGRMPGTLSWLRNPAAQASAHYLVTKTGAVYQLVRDEDTAWHAGFVNKPAWPLYDGTNPNRYTIGIEHEALGGESLTEAQYQATLELHRMLSKRLAIPIDSDHIIGHNRIDAVNRPNDPGKGFPWDRLFKELKEHQLVTVPIYVQGKPIQGFIMDDTSYAPVRDLAVALGRTVEWDTALRAAIIPPVLVKIPTAPANGVNIATGKVVFPGRLVNDRTYAPVRMLAESLGRNVRWDGVNRVVVIE